MRTQLSVNLNAIAMLRNRRNLPWPDLLYFADIALRAGAHGLTVHPRPDERHIRFQDITDIRNFLDENYPEAEFNIEGYPSEHFLSLIEGKAQQVTLVPDRPEQKTSDHGWPLKESADFLFPIIAHLKKQNVRVSLFVDAEEKDLEIAKQLGADRIEFYTGPYAIVFFDKKKRDEALKLLKTSAAYAKSLGLGINAGHDLTLENLSALIETIPYINEVSIGHALTASALEYGMEKTVRLFQEKL